MLNRSELWKIARARLADAKALHASRRYDGAVYLCGYAVEVALKARICKTLKWDGYPSTASEFQDYRTFRTHNLDVLLRLTGAEKTIKTELPAQWSVVASWDPEARYKNVGSTTKQDAELMIDSARGLLARL